MKVPILRLNNTLLTSIQIDLTDQEALEFQADVLESVTTSSAKGVVIDITAMEVVDSFMARVLNETASMVRFLGAEAVICGMQPAVALTLIEMGREVVGVQTALNLDRALAQLESMTQEREEEEESLDEGYVDDAIVEFEGSPEEYLAEVA